MIDMVSYVHSVCGIPERPASPPEYSKRAPRCYHCNVDLHSGEIVQCPGCGLAIEMAHVRAWRGSFSDEDDFHCNCGCAMSEQDIRKGHMEDAEYCLKCGRVGADARRD